MLKHGNSIYFTCDNFQNSVTNISEFCCNALVHRIVKVNTTPLCKASIAMHAWFNIIKCYHDHPALPCWPLHLVWALIVITPCAKCSSHSVWLASLLLWNVIIDIYLYSKVVPAFILKSYSYSKLGMNPSYI